MASSSSSSSSKKRDNETVFGFASGTSKPTSKKQKKEAAALESLQNVNIQKIMESTGPVVQCVLLKADGTEEEIEVDMTPSLRRCQEILGGELTFLGQWEDLQVVILVSKDQSGKGIKKNNHKLQPPFHAETAYGDILLTRSDDDGEAAHFRLSEYTAFKNKKITEWKPAFNAEDGSESGDEEEESGGDEEDEDIDMEMEEEEVLEIFLPRLVEAFKEEYKRDPNEEEIEELKAKILDGDGEGDEEEILALFLPQLIDAFVAENKREPTEEEIEDLKAQVLSVNDNEEDGEGREDSGSDDSGSDEDSDDGEELDAVMEQLVPKLIASFLEQNGRAPTEGELEALKGRLKTNLMAQVEGSDEDDEEEEEEEGSYRF